MTNRSFLIALAIASLGLVSMLGFKFDGGKPLSDVAPYNHPIFTTSQNLTAQIADYEKRLKSDPDGQLVLTSLAALYAKQAKLTGDFPLFDRAEELAGKSYKEVQFYNDGAKVVLADIAQARHEFKTAIALSREIIASKYSRRQGKLGALSVLVTSYLATGDLKNASSAADLLVDLYPSVGSYDLHALVMTAQGRDEEALYDFKSAFAHESFGDYAESSRLRCYWGRFSMKHGQYERADGLFKEALRIVPNDPMALNLLGELELREKKYHEAESHFIEAFSASKQMVFLLGEIQAKRLAGETAEADDLNHQVEKLIRSELNRPRSYAHRLELVRLLLDRGDQAEPQVPQASLAPLANETIELAQQELKGRQSAETLFYLAKSYARAGDWDQARKTVRLLLDTGVHDPEYFGLAESIERSLKNPAKAKFYLDRQHELDSHYSNA
jgi:tetratricopeptide (TPR) repeat protein